MAEHGEVFTPPWMVEAMLDLLGHESERIDSRVLEPACGSGNFLVPVLKRKLATVHGRYGRSSFERSHHALFALMSVYGIELLEDNVRECRQNLLAVFSDYLKVEAATEWHRAAAAVVELNIVHGDALSMTTRSATPEPFTFAEWAYLGKGVYRRRDFQYDKLTQMSSFGDELPIGDPGKHEIFMPTRDHGSLSVSDIARAGGFGE